MLPVIITISDKIDAAYEVDSQARNTIANALQVSYFLTREVNLSVRESVAIWADVFTVTRKKFEVFAALHRREWQWLCQGIRTVIRFVIAAWQMFVNRVDEFVASCEKSEDQVIDERLEELGIATVEQIRVFVTAYFESFTTEQTVKLSSIDYEAMTLRELWHFACPTSSVIYAVQFLDLAGA